MKKVKQRLLLFTLLSSLSTASFAYVSPPVLQVKNFHGISYLTGGIGLDERYYLDARKSQFNFRIEMARSDGSYLGEGFARIVDHHGRIMLDAKFDGPILLADLPAGKYQIDLVFHGKVKRNHVVVPRHGQKRLVTHWRTGERDLRRVNVEHHSSDAHARRMHHKRMMHIRQKANHFRY